MRQCYAHLIQITVTYSLVLLGPSLFGVQTGVESRIQSSFEQLLSNASVVPQGIRVLALSPLEFNLLDRNTTLQSGIGARIEFIVAQDLQKLLAAMKESFSNGDLLASFKAITGFESTTQITLESFVVHVFCIPQ